jgi:histidinol-phosphate aminotransferase
VPTFRPDVREISPYVPGRPIADVAAEYGFDPDSVVKLASNENPLPPLPEVREVMAATLSGVNRYPDNEGRLLRAALADQLGVAFGEVMVGAGSSELLRVIAMAAGGPGTSAVYAWPSFIIYRLGSVLAMSARIEVPLDADRRHDLEAMAAAIRDDTTVVYVCNPNNPTGTVVGFAELARFVERVPEGALVVVDEAYHDYVTDPGYATAVPLALERPNVVVTRTFSKIHGLAALRVGYLVGRPDVITELRKAQAPFTVSTTGQEGALESLRHPHAIAGRGRDNASERSRLQAELRSLGVEVVDSQANFISLRLRATTEETTAAFLRHGVILRPFGGGWVRVSVGSPPENDRFLEAMTSELSVLL